MDEIRIIPQEIINIIPKFDGDNKLLNFFIRKCEYVMGAYRIENNKAQELYLFHAISSRLRDRAAHLISERDDVNTWTKLKELLIQQFQDPRSEECISLELENLKISNGESYLDFYRRIQNVRSALSAKVNLIEDESVKDAKTIIYNNTALNVFLFNLPENIFRMVRLKGCETLEDALPVVLEEVTIMNQYNSHNKFRSNASQFHSFGNNIGFGSQNKPNSSYSVTHGFGQPSSQPCLFGASNQSAQSYKLNTPQNQTMTFGQPIPKFGFGIPKQQSKESNQSQLGFGGSRLEPSRDSKDIQISSNQMNSSQTSETKTKEEESQ